jgi:serine/threonine protein kinase/WD40 repeat protein
MTSKQLDEEVIFNAARKIESPQDRSTFIRNACGDDAALVVRIHALLDVFQQDASFLTSLPAEILAMNHQSAVECAGTEIGPYKLLEQIGEGGFGLVFVAEQQKPLLRRVALKVIKPGMDTRDVIARFEVEREALALMDHPNIARVLDAGATDLGRPYFVMELVRGVPITDFCDQNQLTLRDRLELFIPVCHAVQHAHQKGIIHRDIKPSNVLVTLHDGRPVIKVIDFGVAKAIGGQLHGRAVYTRFTQMIGTPPYMSPEQAELGGLDIDTRTDIYSLGVLLYELLTGTTPHDRVRLATSSHEEVRRIIREEDPPTPSTRLSQTGHSLKLISAQRKSDPVRLSKLVRVDLDWIVMKSLEKERARRYETADGLAQDVQRFLADEPVEACPPSAGYRLRRFVRKNRTLLVTGSAFVALLMLGAIVSTWQAIRLSREGIIALTNLNRAESAEQEANERLFRSSLAQARSLRLTGRIGQRFESLRALGQATSITRSLRKDESITLELRDETVACLALPDLQIEDQWSVQTAFLGSDSFDPTLTRYVVSDVEGNISVRQVSDRREVAHLAGFGRRLHNVWAQFSPNGRYLAVQYWFDELSVQSIVWDLENSSTGYAIPFPTQALFLAFSPDSRQVAGRWADFSVRVFNLLDRTTHTVASESNVTHVAFRADGKQLAFTSFEQKEVRVVELEYDQVVAVLDHPAELFSIAWSPDGRLLAAGCDDCKTYVWDTKTSRRQSVLAGHQKQVYVLSFNPTSEILTTSSSDDSTCLWDPISGKRLVTGAGWCSGFSVDGQRLGFHQDDKMSVWKLADGSECRRHHPGRVGNAASWNPFKGPVSPTYSPDGRWLVSATFDGVHMWDTTNQGEVAYLPIGHQEISFFHPRDNQLFTFGRNGLSCWPIVAVAEHEPNALLLGPPRQLPVAAGWDWDYRACISGDGRMLAAADPTLGQVTLIDLEYPEKRRVIDNCQRVISLALSVDGRYLATGHVKNGIHIWETDTGQLVSAFKEELGESEAASMSFSPDGQWFTTSIRGACCTWRVGPWNAGPVATGKRSKVWTAPPAFSSDSRMMAVISSAQIVTLYDVARGKPLVSLTPADPHSLCGSCFSPDGGQLAVGAEDHTIQLWDLRRLRNELEALDLDWDLPSYPEPTRVSMEAPPLIVAYGLVEAECLNVIDHQHCEYSIEDMRPHRPKQWSSRKQLACRAEPGGYLELEMPIATAGGFRLAVAFTKGPHYGRVRVDIDGAEIGGVVDAFDTETAPMGLTILGEVELRPGVHRIGFTAVDKDPQATHCDIGIDALTLSPLESGSFE